MISTGVARAVVFPSSAVPPPHLPLKKRSADQLRLQSSARSEPESVVASTSPTRSAGLHSDARGSSIRLEGDRQQGATSKEQEAFPDVGEAYISPSTIWTRARGMTSTSQTTPTVPLRELKQSSSIPDLASFRATQRNMVSSTYRPERGPNNRDTSSSFRSPPPVPWKDTDEVRSSFRSALNNGSLLNNGEVRSSFRSAFTNGSYVTYASSGYIDASETERSSVVTRASSVSDLFYKSKFQGLEDEGMSVEDAIALYANGFTDDELERKLDQGIEDIIGYMPEPLPVDDSKPHPPILSEDFAPLTSPVKTATRYDHSFKDDLIVPPSPSKQQIPLSPLQAHPVRAPSPTSKDYAPKPTSVSEPTPVILEKTLPPLRPAKPAEPIAPIPRDRYGFKKITQYVTEEQYDAWNLPYTEYLDRRRRKWIALMTQWGLSKEKPIRFPPKSDKVKRYIRKGIPPDWRGAAWFWYAGGPARLAQNPGLYQRLCTQAETGKLCDTDREIIERDLNRTFPDNIRFKPDPIPEPPSTKDFPGRDVRPARSSSRQPVGETPILKSLRRVLQAFSIHNPNIGYCQSLNFLAGLLLIFLDEDEEKVFILLNIITSVHLPGTHAKVLEANVDVGVLMTCIQESMPAVWAKIDDINGGRGEISTNRLPTVSLATTAWFMSCFVGNLPIETVLRVWDSFFYEGSKTLFRIALAIFKTGEWEIRNVNEHMEIFQVVQLIPRRLIDASALMESCFKRRNGFGHLSQETIDARRKERRATLQRDRDRKNGQLNPTLDDERVSRPDSRGSGLRRMASRSRLRRAQSKRRLRVQEAI
jgi:hypothetical protein